MLFQAANAEKQDKTVSHVKRSFFFEFDTDHLVLKPFDLIKETLAKSPHSGIEFNSSFHTSSSITASL